MLVFWVVTPCGFVGRYQRFVRKILPTSSGLKKKAVCSSKTMESTYESTWRYSTEAQHRNLIRKVIVFLR